MKGKLTLILLGLTVASFGAFGVASAERNSNAQSHVYLNVDPNIAVAADAASVNLGAVQTGIFGCHLVFNVDANTQKVQFYSIISRLYKGDDCTGQSVPPIEIAVPPGVTLDAANANPTGGHSHVAAYIAGVATQATCFTGLQTETVTYESSQNNHFSQSVTVSPCWNQTDPEKPVGEYSGFVSLFALVVLPGTI